MDKNREDKESAIKLINKYADSYSLLEHENKQLKNEIIDLRLNLKINKEIIEGFYTFKNQSEKDSLYINKIEEAQNSNIHMINYLTKENEELRYRLNYIEQCNSEKVNYIKIENEKLKNKLFILENIVLKKDNLILGYKKKLENPKDNEIFVTEPSKIVLQINDELTIYKDIYNKLINGMNSSRITISKYERTIHELQNENARLNNELKNINKIRLDEIRDLDSTPKTIVRGNSVNISNKSDNVNNNNIDNILKRLNQSIQKPLKKYYEYDEWWNEALKNSNLNQNEFNRYKMIKQNYKIIDLIEYLNSVIIDKNLQIKILDEEVAALSNSYEILNKEFNELNKRVINRNINESLENNLSSNSVLFKRNKNDEKKLNTISSITSAEFKEEFNERIFSITNESGCIEQINININVR